MPMTDPRQMERNYGKSVLRDTVSLKTLRLLLDCSRLLLPAHAAVSSACACVCASVRDC